MSSGSTRWSVWIAVLNRLRGTSSQVYTRCTPGTASAAVLSIDTMRACACGECSTFRCSMPSISVSIVYSARAGDDVGARGRADAGADRLARLRRSSIAATPLTASSIARYPVQRHRFPFSARGRSCFCSSVNVADGHDHAGGAEAALEAGGVAELPLHRVQVVRRAEALDRGDLAAVGAERGRDAAVHRIAVEPHRAGAAIACVAALLDAEPAERADEGAQALTRAAAPRRRSCR